MTITSKSRRRTLRAAAVRACIFETMLSAGERSQGACNVLLAKAHHVCRRTLSALKEDNSAFAGSRMRGHEPPRLWSRTATSIHQLPAVHARAASRGLPALSLEDGRSEPRDGPGIQQECRCMHGEVIGNDAKARKLDLVDGGAEGRDLVGETCDSSRKKDIAADACTEGDDGSPRHFGVYPRSWRG